MFCSVFWFKQQNLFNISKEGKGIKHWLSDVSLKSQKEVIASGKNVKSNLRKLNIAQLSGIAYSSVMLGVLLPKLNIWMTKKQEKNNIVTAGNQKIPLNFSSMEQFEKNIAQRQL